MRNWTRIRNGLLAIGTVVYLGISYAVTVNPDPPLAVVLLGLAPLVAVIAAMRKILLGSCVKAL